MNLEHMISQVQKQMPAMRWNHTVGVMATAVKLAERFHGDVQKAELAALLHDYCKYWAIDRQRQVMREQQLSSDLLDYDKQLWHAPVAAFVVKAELGIANEEVLDAIRYHTSGRENMTQLDKIVCLADYMEPGRDFPEVNNIRKLAEDSLDKALIAGFDSTISFLISKGERIYPLTLIARNSLIATRFTI
jgi:predicted HD superfamily hydrolase involved in NAD metabolism